MRERHSRTTDEWTRWTEEKRGGKVVKRTEPSTGRQQGLLKMQATHVHKQAAIQIVILGTRKGIGQRRRFVENGICITSHFSRALNLYISFRITCFGIDISCLYYCRGCSDDALDELLSHFPVESSALIASYIKPRASHQPASYLPFHHHHDPLVHL